MRKLLISIAMLVSFAVPAAAQAMSIQEINSIPAPRAGTAEYHKCVWRIGMYRGFYYESSPAKIAYIKQEFGVGDAEAEYIEKRSGFLKWALEMQDEESQYKYLGCYNLLD